MSQKSLTATLDAESQTEETRSFIRRVRVEKEDKLEDGNSGSRIPWNRLRANEEKAIVALTQALPELSLRQLVFSLVGKYGY